MRDLFGIQFNELDHTTDVSISDLQPGVANRLSDGIRVDNVEAANALIEEYEAEIEAKNDASRESGDDKNGEDAGASADADKKAGSTNSSSGGSANR